MFKVMGPHLKKSGDKMAFLLDSLLSVEGAFEGAPPLLAPLLLQSPPLCEVFAPGRLEAIRLSLSKNTFLMQQVRN